MTYKHASPDTLIYRMLNLQNDLLALVHLLNEVEQADQGGGQVTEASLLEQLTWSEQDPTPNNWVATLADNSLITGYGTLQKIPIDVNADLQIVVHPAWRRQGIGSQLFRHLLTRATELDTRALRAYVAAQDTGGDRFVRSHEFTPAASYMHLSLTEMRPFPQPTLPQGFNTRSYDQIERVDIYTEALNRCYDGYWGHLQCTQESIARLLPHQNHAGMFLLFAPEGTIAGTCRANLSEANEHGKRTALIDAPGIVASHREKDLALPLLLTAIHWLLPQHPAELELEAWGETPGNLADYQALGFAPLQEEISYRRNLG